MRVKKGLPFALAARRSALVTIGILAISFLGLASPQGQAAPVTSIGRYTGIQPVSYIDGLAPMREPNRPVDPDMVLWDQYDSPGVSASTSQNFEAEFDTFDNQTADSFTIQLYQTWLIDKVEVAGAYSGAGVANSFNVFFYEGAPNQPAMPVFTKTNALYSPGLEFGDVVIELDPPARITSQSTTNFWISVQADQNLRQSGQWFWRNARFFEDVYPAYWRNPGGGFNTGCFEWYVRSGCGLSGNEREQVFRLSGTNLGIVPSPTGTPPTVTPTTIASETPTQIVTPDPTTTGTPPTPTNTPFVPPPVLTQQVVTFTPEPTYQASPTATASVPGQSCPAAYADLPAHDPDFATVHCVTCRNIMETFACGQPGGEPCVPPYNYPYFRPTAGWAGTNADVAKSLSIAAGYIEPPGVQIFADVPPSHRYFVYIQRMVYRGIMEGFPCGGPGEPCDTENRPYFRPTGAVSRGQYARYLSITLNFTDPTGSQTYEDVPPSHLNFVHIERVSSRGLIQGFPCGSPGEPCIAPLNRPYFRPWASMQSVTRVDYARIIVRSFSPICSIEPTSTPTSKPYGFEDVPPAHTFYPFVQCLAHRGIVSGYPCGYPEPCLPPYYYPYYRPGNLVSRGQITKIVSEAAGITDPVSGQTFHDIRPGSTFYTYTERLVARQIVEGYPCGGPGEPCYPPDNRPYYRPNGSATRGQLTKIVANAAGFQDPVSAQTFEDVTVNDTFYIFIERLAMRAVMQGYPCGGPGEPCAPPLNRPYFRPGANVTRGQSAKIVANTFFPNCQIR